MDVTEQVREVNGEIVADPLFQYYRQPSLDYVHRVEITTKLYSKSSLKSSNLFLAHISSFSNNVTLI